MTASIVDAASRAALDAIDRTVVVSSGEVGWRSLLVEHHVVAPRSQVIEVPPTDDQTVVVGLAGEQHIEVIDDGRRTRSFFDRDCVGLTPGGEGYRLRRLPTLRARTVEKVNIYIPVQVMAEVAEDLRRPGGRAPRPLRALSRPDPSVGVMARRLARAVADRAPDAFGEAAAVHLAAHLFAAHDDGRGRVGPVGRRDVARVDAAVDLIHGSFGDPLSVGMLAAQANTSRYHFSRLFRTAMGCSPHEYLTRVRLQAARELLSTTDRSVADIGRSCGYPDPSYFASVFARRFGVPPTACR